MKKTKPAITQLGGKPLLPKSVFSREDDAIIKHHLTLPDWTPSTIKDQLPNYHSKTDILRYLTRFANAEQIQQGCDREAKASAFVKPVPVPKDVPAFMPKLKSTAGPHRWTPEETLLMWNNVHTLTACNENKEKWCELFPDVPWSAISRKIYKILALDKEQFSPSDDELLCLSAEEYGPDPAIWNTVLSAPHSRHTLAKRIAWLEKEGLLASQQEAKAQKEQATTEHADLKSPDEQITETETVLMEQTPVNPDPDTSKKETTAPMTDTNSINQCATIYDIVQKLAQDPNVYINVDIRFADGLSFTWPPSQFPANKNN